MSSVIVGVDIGGAWPMRTLLMAGVAATWLTNVAVAVKVDAELGTLSCNLEAPEAAIGSATTSTESQMRDAFCVFKARNGSEEAYVGTVQGVSLSKDKTTTLIWAVKGEVGTTLMPGLLQQSYAVDQSIPADQGSPLIGETRSNVVLQSMADKPEGSVSATQRPKPSGFVVIGVELRNL
jgi:hypothetical protein